MFDISDRARAALAISLQEHPRGEEGCLRVIRRFDDRLALVVQPHKPGDLTFSTDGEVVCALSGKLRRRCSDYVLDVGASGEWVLRVKVDRDLRVGRAA